MSNVETSKTAGPWFVSIERRNCQVGHTMLYFADKPDIEVMPGWVVVNGIEVDQGYCFHADTVVQYDTGYDETLSV